ncbi:DUF1573 domain-containing protein [Fulvivirga ulvae]|uniref:DUF1573 domain-containing protein n=1 Tax=Fulvivirga ulvae TaxID=2904245 RepID=UPI001F15AD20|nr:DUF1573 domain-containing protein [Fulvivirga ulvae]UII33803.1 DUF1573 domain-containing protein [Fulvivirga ulvae]
MNKLLSTIAFILLAAMSYAQDLVTSTNNADFLWEESLTYDFGKITLNEPAIHTFRFTNNGETPLIISSAKASCGCTVAAYTREAIMPGETGEITATYNAKKSGPFQKGITITSNARDNVVVLYLKGEVTE